MRWFRDAFCDMEKLEAQELGIDTYEILEEKAKKSTSRLTWHHTNIFR